METPIEAVKIDQIWSALQGKGKNRGEVIEEAIEHKDIRDLRLLRPWIDLVEDNSWGDQVIEDVVPVLGDAAIAPLRKGFSLPGKASDCRRLQGLVKLEGKKAEPLVLESLEKGSNELKQTAIEELGELNPKEVIARAPALMKEKAAGLRAATLTALAKNVSDEGLEYLIAAVADDDYQINSVATSSLPNFAHPKRNERLLALLTPDLIDIKEPTRESFKKELEAKEKAKAAAKAAKAAKATKKGAKGAKGKTTVKKAATKKVAAKKVAKKAVKKAAKKTARRRTRYVVLTAAEQKQFNKIHHEYQKKHNYAERIIELWGECGIKEATPTLMKIFQEKDHHLQDKATSALLQLGDPKAMAEIAKRLENPKAYPNVDVAIDAIFTMEPAQTYDYLEHFLQPKFMDKKDSYRVVGSIFDRFSEDPWDSSLKPEVFVKHVKEEPRWEKLFYKIIDHEKYSDRAVTGLCFIASTKDVSSFDFYNNLKSYFTPKLLEKDHVASAAGSLVEAIEYAYGDTQKLFKDPVWSDFLADVAQIKNKKRGWVIRNAVEQLVERSDARAIPGLLSMLSDKSPYYYLFEWLGRFQDPRIAPAILKRLQLKHKFDLETVYQIVRGQGDKSVIPTLQKMLQKKKRGKEADQLKQTIKHLEALP